jgi:hypothetical protein
MGRRKRGMILCFDAVFHKITQWVV